MELCVDRLVLSLLTVSVLGCSGGADAPPRDGAFGDVANSGDSNGTVNGTTTSSNASSQNGSTSNTAGSSGVTGDTNMGGQGNQSTNGGEAGEASNGGAPGEDEHQNPDPNVPVQCNGGSLKEYSGNGSITFYTFDMGTETPHCSFPIEARNPDSVAGIATGSGRYFGAINTSDYAGAATCGACVEVTRDNSRKVVVTVVDECPVDSNPKCQAGHIDLSKEAFLQIATEGEGYVGTGNGGGHGQISWRYVPCEPEQDIAFILKEPDNQNWNEILVLGHRHPIAKVEVRINGNWVTASRQEYNYWQPPNGKMGDYVVRATDIYGNAIQGDVQLNTSGEQTSGTQFPACL